MLPLRLYVSIASWIFHVETLMQVIFASCIHCSFFCFKTQVILSTNIAESSVTVPDVKYGKSSKSCNCVYTVFVMFSLLYASLNLHNMSLFHKALLLEFDFDSC